MSGGWSGRDVLSDLDIGPVVKAHNDLTGNELRLRGRLCHFRAETPDSLRVTFDRFPVSQDPGGRWCRSCTKGSRASSSFSHYQWVDPDHMDIRVSTLQDGQDVIIAERLAEILGG